MKPFVDWLKDEIRRTGIKQYQVARVLNMDPRSFNYLLNHGGFAANMDRQKLREFFVKIDNVMAAAISTAGKEKSK